MGSSLEEKYAVSASYLREGIAALEQAHQFPFPSFYLYLEAAEHLLSCHGGDGKAAGQVSHIAPGA